MKTYLDVPFEQKERAKELGARWDAARKRWFVPDGVDLFPFLHWVPGMEEMDSKVKKALKKGR